MDLRILELQKQAAARDDVITLAGALPARELLPRAELALALREVVTSRDDALQYGWPEGIAQLRGWIAARLATRGARVDPERVIITAGAQQALAVAATAVDARSIIVGDATYPGALDAFARAGMASVCVAGDARYAIPGVSNPHGVESHDRKDVLAGSGSLIIDEAYAELRFDGRLSSPLLVDAPDRTWHIGTISKTLAPGLRVGWLIPPPRCQAAALDTKQAADLQTSGLGQAALVRLLAFIDYDAWLARARAFYARRASALTSALRRHVPGIRFVDPEGGLSVWVETEDRGDERDLLQRALDHGVMFDPGKMFRPQPSRYVAFRLSFGNTAPELLEEAARRLGRTLAQWRRRARDVVWPTDRA
jgi:2-aminoadipate transaminase